MISKLLNFIGSIPKDKILHCFGGYLIFDICIAIGTCFNFSKIAILELSFIILMLSIFGKEIYDNTKPNNKFDWSDIIAGLWGVCFKLIIYIFSL